MLAKVRPPDRGLASSSPTNHANQLVPPQCFNRGIDCAPINDQLVEVAVKAVDDVPGCEFIAQLAGDLNYAIP